MGADEVPLTAGISTPGVVRVGDTVRRPLKPDSDLVHALLGYVEQRGFDGAPRFRGTDSRAHVAVPEQESESDAAPVKPAPRPRSVRERWAEPNVAQTKRPSACPSPHRPSDSPDGARRHTSGSARFSPPLYRREVVAPSVRTGLPFTIRLGPDLAARGMRRHSSRAVSGTCPMRRSACPAARPPGSGASVLPRPA